MWLKALPHCRECRLHCVCPEADGDRKSKKGTPEPRRRLLFWINSTRFKPSGCGTGICGLRDYMWDSRLPRKTFVEPWECQVRSLCWGSFCFPEIAASPLMWDKAVHICVGIAMGVGCLLKYEYFFPFKKAATTQKKEIGKKKTYNKYSSTLRIRAGLIAVWWHWGHATA